jgi:cytochrome c oxidase cbb3-type subunit 3
MRLLVAMLASALVLPFAGCGWQLGYPPPALARPSDIHDFTALYNENCAACHGRDGENGPATDLANPEYEALIDDATLHKWIAAGMAGTQMPAFGQANGGMLTDQQVSDIVAGMRREWLRPNAFAGAQPPPYAQAQAGDDHRGQQVYQARCAMCHTQSNQEVTSPVYLALVTDQVLRSTIIAGSPDIGQPDWRHDSAGGQPAPPLSAQDVDDIIAYLAAVRNSQPAYAGSGANPPPGPPRGVKREPTAPGPQ